MSAPVTGHWASKLRVERVGYGADGRARWRLLIPLIYRSLKYGVVAAPAGFVTNYASVPRLPVVFLYCGDVSYDEAAMHDWLYTCHSVDRETADAIFLEMLTLNPRVGAIRARVMWAGVRIGGQGAWETPTTVQQATRVAALFQVP